jgi:hypothetical protein
LRLYIIRFILLFVLLTGLSFTQVYGQKKSNKNRKSELQESRKDSSVLIEGVPVNVYTETPDSNFNYENYISFLQKVSDKSKYIVLPINEFRKTIDSTKIVIGLRHDVDLDLGKAVLLSEVEKSMHIRSTYYILHTAPYYLANPENKAIHSELIIPVLKHMQDDSGFEIGWHNDLVTLQVIYNIDPVAFLKQELGWLRSNGIKIYGSASHGSYYCRPNGYLNYYFFNECTNPPGGLGAFPNNVTVTSDSKTITLSKGSFKDFDLEYGAYFLNSNKYYSDASFVNGKRWDIGMLDLNSLKAGDRVIILMHPIYWHKASILSEIQNFYIPGQKRSIINSADSSITVTLPVGAPKNNLTPTFALSPGANARISGVNQMSGVSVNNFDNPLVYSVSGENRNHVKNWTVTVQNALASQASFESFTIKGITKKVSIDTKKKTIKVRVDSEANLSGLTAVYIISEGASAWVGLKEQKSNSGIVDFSQPVIYKIVGEDGVTTSLWTITVRK